MEQEQGNGEGSMSKPYEQERFWTNMDERARKVEMARKARRKQLEDLGITPEMLEQAKKKAEERGDDVPDWALDLAVKLTTGSVKSAKELVTLARQWRLFFPWMAKKED